MRAEVHRKLSQPFGGADLAVADGWREYACAIDRSAHARALLWAVFAHLKKRVASLTQRALLHADPVLDLHLCEPLERTLDDARRQFRWYERQRLAEPAQRTVRQTEALWRARHQGEVRGLSQWLWAPIDRVTTPARPAGLTRRLRGSMSSDAYDTRNPVDTRKSFHTTFDAELTTMELSARCVYEHPEMPEDFHRNMARQVSDEARHARACLDVLAELGGRYGEFPISTGVYGFNCQFRACEPGSKRELLWRLLLRSVLQESLSLDGFPLLIKKREHYGLNDIARVFEGLMADEVFHVGSGLRWSTYLCDGGRGRVREELAQAHACYVSYARNLREKYYEQLRAQRGFLDALRVRAESEPWLSDPALERERRERHRQRAVDPAEFDAVERLYPFRCLLYVLVRHLRCEHVFETGVLHGHSSAFVLLAMERNGLGRLVSVDLPKPDCFRTGRLIPDALRSRHEPYRGSSREHLPRLLGALGRPLDLFVHDSEHSYENMMFEMSLAYMSLRQGGVLVVDNIEFNSAFEDFARGVNAPVTVVHSRRGAERPWRHGVLRKVAAYDVPGARYI